MKKKQSSSIDGFVPRRVGSKLGDLHNNGTFKRRNLNQPSKELHSGDDKTNPIGQQLQGRIIDRSDIDDSLKSIDNSSQDGLGKPERQHRRNKRLKPPHNKHRVVKIILFTLLAVVLAIGGYLAFKALSTIISVSNGNIFGLIQKQPLKEDANGRSNILIFGTAEDDKDWEHEGANLTDSIMVLSVDQTNYNAYMVSLPRDLWVTYDEGCMVGYQGKLNAVYFCASDDGSDEAAGAQALQNKVGEILGLDIQYYTHVNFTVFVDAVDAVGGIDVKIESDDPRGILDRNLDWRCNFNCYYVNYKNGETVHLDGEHALALARARNSSDGYGLSGGNFDREKNQQKILKALREKAVSAGTLTNIVAVTDLIDALSDNLRTNFNTKEIQTLISIANNTPSEAIKSLSLVEEDNPLVTTGSYNDQSIVRPVRGLLDYTDIRTYIAKNLTNNPIIKEGAEIAVLNGSSQPNLAQNQAEKLTSAGLIVNVVDNAPEGSYDAIEVYQIGDGNTATAAKIREILSVKTIKTSSLPVVVDDNIDFVIILGR